MSEGTASLVTVIIAALASFAAFWAAWETRRTAKATNNTAESSALNDFLKEYSHPANVKVAKDASGLEKGVWR